MTIIMLVNLLLAPAMSQETSPCPIQTIEITDLEQERIYMENIEKQIKEIMKKENQEVETIKVEVLVD